MIHNIKSKLSYLGVVSILLAGVFSSCSNEVNLSGVDDSGFGKADTNYVALKNCDDPRPMRVVELRDNGDTLQVNLRLSKALSQDYTANLTTDQAALDAYNSANGTDFTMFPAADVTFTTTSATVNAGQTQSAPVSIILKGGSNLTVGTSYVLPVTFTNTNTDVKTSAGDGTYLFIVKYMGIMPDAAKASGIKTIMIYEINDNNPLNAGEYTLTGTPGGVDDGKPLADMVVLFAANINYSTTTGKVYVSMNPQVTAILNNRDKYIKPLQDKGIKVILGILGNHDVSGMCDLTDASSRDFAQQLKAVVDAFGLDGTFFDDEYSSYVANPPAGFAYPTGALYSQLLYNVKAAMPDKPVIMYNFSDYNFNYDMAPSVEDVNGLSHDAETFIDYACEARYGGFDSSMSSYLYLPNAQISPYSRKCDDGLDLSSYDDFFTYTTTSLQKVRNSGYGAFTLYNLRLEDSHHLPNNYVPAFNDIAKYLYDGQIVFSGVEYPRDY